VLVEITSDAINLNILFGHRKRVNGNTNLSMAVAFVGKELGYSLGVGRVGT